MESQPCANAIVFFLTSTSGSYQVLVYRVIVVIPE